MKNVRILTLCLVLFCAAFTSSQAQVFDGKNFIGAKVLFVDYGNPNSIDTLDWTNGIEAFYRRNISDYFALTLPGKAGFANVMGDINNRLFTSVDLLGRLQYYQPDNRLVPYLFAGAGLNWEETLGFHSQIPFGAGLDIKVGRNSYVNLQGEYRVASEDDRDNMQIGAGLVYRLGGKPADTDGDGISDAEDQCPEQPGTLETMGCPDTDGDGVADAKDMCPEVVGTLELNGCPDSDGDGVIDSKDECPNEAGPLNGCPDSDDDGVADKDDKCPDTAGPASFMGCPDTDGDGIADHEDNCPNEAGTAASNGCPVTDSDGDGFEDAIDKCPNEAGPVNGCPDTDGDGVADRDDRCPEKAGPYTGCPDTDEDGLIDPDDACPTQAGPTTNKGCPEIKEADREVLNFAMRAVQFETGSAVLKRESNEILDQIVSILNRYPGYQLRIKGHTDNVGDAQRNQILSEDRAKSCFTYLAANGVEPSRMQYAGYGETRPVADNNTSSGRKLNRRVEFDLYIE